MCSLRTGVSSLQINEIFSGFSQLSILFPPDPAEQRTERQHYDYPAERKCEVLFQFRILRHSLAEFFEMVAPIVAVELSKLSQEIYEGSTSRARFFQTFGDDFEIHVDVAQRADVECGDSVTVNCCHQYWHDHGAIWPH